MKKIILFVILLSFLFVDSYAGFSGGKGSFVSPRVPTFTPRQIAPKIQGPSTPAPKVLSPKESPTPKPSPRNYYNERTRFATTNPSMNSMFLNYPFFWAFIGQNGPINERRSSGCSLVK